MIEHNYYRLMEIDPYSDIDTVKQKYRELAKLYHPDKNPKNRHAEEYFKILTQGYHILSEPDKKLEYDALLKNYISGKTNPLPAAGKDEVVRMKIKRHREHKRLEFIENYVRAENEFPHRYRFLLAVMTFISGILLCYNNWFINLLNYKILYIVVGSFLFGMGAYLIAENIYNRQSFKKAMRIEEYGEDAGPVKIFMLLFFCTPVLFLGIMDLSKTVHLKYFYDITLVEKVIYIQDEVTFYYEVNGEKISRRTEAVPGYDYAYLSDMRVKFSRINPYISELIIPDEAYR